jgi:hypothetical protein
LWNEQHDFGVIEYTPQREDPGFASITSDHTLAATSWRPLAEIAALREIAFLAGLSFAQRSLALLLMINFVRLSPYLARR